MAHAHSGVLATKLLLWKSICGVGGRFLATLLREKVDYKAGFTFIFIKYIHHFF